MSKDQLLAQTIAAFNDRQFVKAVQISTEGCELAEGRDRLFWLGLQETCIGFSQLMENELPQAESKLVAAMEKLRNFGFRYENFEITAALAGIRQGIEEIRSVRGKKKRAFDVTLLPTLKLAAKADL
jgi:hypothetical protein